MAMKADDRTCWPACADGPMRKGCHSMVGASGIFTKDQRRVLEAKHAATTRQTIKRMGLWKSDWPKGDDE
jgi:hypothetical protein